MKNLFNKITLIFFVAAMATACTNENSEYYTQTVEIPDGYTVEQKIELSGKVLPHPRQMLWWEDEFKGFIHYGPNTYSGREWGTGFEESDLFHPTGLDTDQWCEMMSAAGITRVIMVVKHHDGYCLWQTRYTDHSVVSSDWKNGKGDVLKELAKSCEKYGLRLGVYLSPADLYQIESDGGYYGNDSEFTERTIPRKVEGRPFSDTRSFTYLADDYNEYFLNQLFELLTEYGPIHEVWFDGANPKPGTGQTYNYEAWYDLIRHLAPDAVIFGKGPDSRWCGNEGGRTREDEYNVIPLEVSPDNFDWPDMTNENIAGRDKITEETKFFHYYPAETNTSIRHGWFWRNDEEQQVRNVDDVFDIYERSVGGNSQFHLNIPPNTEGKFSPRDAEVLKAVGKKIRNVYDSDLLAGASASEKNVLDNDNSTWWQAAGKQASLEITLPEQRKINRFMIMEAIANRGERVEEHFLEARIDGQWVKIAEGKTVGHKRILRFPPVETDAFRLTIAQSRLAPAIAHVSAHYYDEPPKPVVMDRNSEGMLNMGVASNFVWRSENTADQSQDIYYTVDGTEPDEQSVKYTEPFSLPMGGHVKARSVVENRMGPVTENRLGILPEGWTAVDSEGKTSEPARVLDGNPYSGWTLETGAGAPFLSVDMQQEYLVAGFTYLPAREGFIESFKVEISNDGQNWTTVQWGTFGNIINDPGQRVVLFDKPENARHFRLSELTAPGSHNRVGAGELQILSGD
ncbi:alpha-L-fucosidase [Tangfeifania diversioriginum]|uniref:alpha-L-fucosidase n=1 Tax=Tangfeifania diversioriginum TaxID=1168035 RepID=A0A1M6BY47_9BACT|nr:alpha-L-fucosidase [Tangfeifania diversioriginum]SHI53533.1 alpha-L-fucosidase [Tangfeifania diversioriginum]